MLVAVNIVQLFPAQIFLVFFGFELSALFLYSHDNSYRIEFRFRKILNFIGKSGSE